MLAPRQLFRAALHTAAPRRAPASCLYSSMTVRTASSSAARLLLRGAVVPPLVLCRIGARRGMAQSTLAQVIGGSEQAAVTSFTGAEKLLLGGLAGVSAAGIMWLTSRGASAHKLHDQALIAAVEADETDFFSPLVRKRLNSTFMVLASGIGVSALAGVVAIHSPALLYKIAAHPVLFGVGTLVAALGGMLICLTANPTDKLTKNLSYGLFTGAMGLSIVPLGVFGGPLILRAAMITGGIVGGLGLVAANAPNEQFLYWGAPLSIALGGVCLASVGSLILPAAAGTIMETIALYAGLAVFGGMLVHDTQKTIAHAKLFSANDFDAYGEAMTVYLDMLNLFVRIVQILVSTR